MTKFWIYILRCADGSYYTGYTTNLEMRLAEHEAGEGSNWTKHRLPIELRFSQEMPDEDYAFFAERQIKKWSRAKKEALIAENWDLLRWLAKKCRGQQHFTYQTVEIFTTETRRTLSFNHFLCVLRVSVVSNIFLSLIC